MRSTEMFITIKELWSRRQNGFHQTTEENRNNDQEQIEQDKQPNLLFIEEKLVNQYKVIDIEYHDAQHRELIKDQRCTFCAHCKAEKELRQNEYYAKEDKMYQKGIESTSITKELLVLSSHILIIDFALQK